ncbi:glycosyltransferase family 2 protein [Chitiniphilus shinanonensis]|uniref:glycosyltransferase family 2 protein n=1 Tax=Chitiniphilus shinanonensis TaxID=553088 RepID=UPI00058DF2E9|nr:glycosyltransferase family 2 protein [Chitiniphilus shinanonensis]
MREIITLLLTIPAAITCTVTLCLLLVYLRRPAKNQQNDESPTVSVLVPFYNEDANVFLKALSLLDAQCYCLPLQVVLIDDGSTNDTPQQVKSWLMQPHRQRFQLLTRELNGGRKGYALDYALASGVLDGEVYVVVDSDTYIAEDGVHQLVKKLWSDSRYAAVCGFIAPENHHGSLIATLQHYEHIGFYGAIRAAQDQLGVVPVLAGAFVAHRASVVRQIGGWGDWLVEDISWCWKALAAHYRTGYAPNAVATTQCPRTYGALFRQRRRWARGRVEAFTTAWKMSWVKGLLFTPWFLFAALQFLFPPTLLMVPLLIGFKIWPPLVLNALILLLYLSFSVIFARRHGKNLGVAGGKLKKIPLFTMMLEILTWVPNILGYGDEILGKRKNWLTR